MKKILVPTDFSECAEAATRVALAIAKKADAEISFLHLLADDLEIAHVPVHTLSWSSNDDRTDMLMQASNELKELVLSARKAGIKAKHELVHDKGEGRLEDFIIPLSIDLVVMGSNGARGLKEVFLGSNTERLIWHSPVPVLVIKNEVQKFEIKNMVLVSDFKSDLALPIHEIVKIANLWNSQLHLLYVNTPNHFRETNDVLADMKRLMHLFPSLSYCPHIYDAHDEERGIHQFAKANKIDLIVITTHGRTPFMGLTHSIAECLINHEQTPVMVVNMDETENRNTK
jgi:nucleotide-binding universal stress UspA family protein